MFPAIRKFDLSSFCLLPVNSASAENYGWLMEDGGTVTHLRFKWKSLRNCTFHLWGRSQSSSLSFTTSCCVTPPEQANNQPQPQPKLCNRSPLGPGMFSVQQPEAPHLMCRVFVCAELKWESNVVFGWVINVKVHIMTSYLMYEGERWAENEEKKTAWV